MPPEGQSNSSKMVVEADSLPRQGSTGTRGDSLAATLNPTNVESPGNDDERSSSISLKRPETKKTDLQSQSMSNTKASDLTKENEANSEDRDGDASKGRKRNAMRDRAAKIVEEIIEDESEEDDYYPNPVDTNASGLQGNWDLEEEAGANPYRSLRRPLVDRLPKAERRMFQHMLYTTLIEDRLASLEESVNSLKGQKAAPVSGEEKKKYGHILKVEYQDWASFQIKPLIRKSKVAWKHGDNVETTPRPIIEVLKGEHQISARRRNQDSQLEGERLGEPNPPNSSLETHDSSQTSVSIQRNPLRVRIRSPILLRILEMVFSERSSTGFDMTGSTESRRKGDRVPAFKPPNLGGQDKALATMLRPFKLLVTKADQLREHLNQLEQIHKTRSTEGDDVSNDPNVKNVSEMETLDKEQGPTKNTPSTTTAPEHKEPQTTVDDLRSEEALKHLRILVNFINDDLKHVWELRRKCREGTLTKIAFADLWHLFDLGQEVRTPETENMQLYRLVAFTGGREPIDWTLDPHEDTAPKRTADHSQGAFCLHCYSLDFDGKQYGPRHTFFTIRRYEGEKDVTSLPCFPLKCDPAAKDLREMLLKRGAEFIELSRPDNAKYRHKAYIGLTIDKEPEQVDSQVIIDFQWAFLRRPNWKPKLEIGNPIQNDGRETTMVSADLGSCGREGCCGNDYVYPDYQVDHSAFTNFQQQNKDAWDAIDSPSELHEDDKVLLPPRAYGFVLRSRKWAAFAIDNLKDVTYNDGWSDLELPDGHKEAVLALVENHAGGQRKSEQTETFTSMDLVRGKGKGLIILLHGEPGVGKTSTAECVADHTRRPLFSITCGDIGDQAYAVEEHLENNFQLAHRWGCVLLLDEADVFLQKRDMSDLARNSIVSVFLRTLEYYSGILFLTTNRVGTLDPAFKSRIHLSLLYPRLSRNSTVKIWKNHLKRLREQIKEGGKSLEIDRRDILVFARSHFDSLSKQDKAPWNGRQIRNAFQTAVALADFQSEARSTPKLNHTQFKKVAETSMEFDRYLEAMYGGRDDALVAERDQTRLDRFATESLRPSATPATTVYRQTAPSMPSMGVNRPTTTTTTGRRGPAVKQQQQQATPPEEAAGLSPHPSDDDDEDDDQEDMEADD